MVLGKLSPRKIAPSPNSNTNPKPNTDPDRGEIFLGGNFPNTWSDILCIVFVPLIIFFKNGLMNLQ